MSKNYLLYWKLKTVEYHYYGESLDHVASDQLGKVEPGDTLWVVTVRAGELFLVGRLRVGQVVDEAESDAVFDDDLLREARWHVIAEGGTAEPMQLINLSDLRVTYSLRFQSQADRLRLDRRGRLNSPSLYQMRLLTDESAALLNYVWRGDVEATETVSIGDDVFVYPEGRPVKQVRTLRQRNTRLVNEAKARYMEAHGHLSCEVCGVNFEDVYGDVGAGYIEAHHPEPISQKDNETSYTDLEDIVLVCANCHRMIHRSNPVLSIQELKHIVEEQRRKEQHD